MIDIKQAVQIANDYYSLHGGLQIHKVYDSGQIWIFFGKKDGRRRLGSSGISIDKESGEVKAFGLPSDKNFEILEAAKSIEI